MSRVPAKKRATRAVKPPPSAITDFCLTVRDFGPIAEAEIRVAPLTILVGKNSTGKSYMASLLWLILNSSETLALRPETRQEGFTPNWFVELSRAPSAHENVIEKEVPRDLLCGWMQDFVAKNKDELISYLFSSEGTNFMDIQFEVCRFGYHRI
jgi:predicted ATPase